MIARTDIDAIAPDRSQSKAAFGALFFLGAFLVFVAGFAGSDALHDAAHDTRHGLSFPCH